MLREKILLKFYTNFNKNIYNYYLLDVKRDSGLVWLIESCSRFIGHEGENLDLDYLASEKILQDLQPVVLPILGVSIAEVHFCGYLD